VLAVRPEKVLLPEVVHLLEDLEAPGCQQGKTISLDSEVAPTVRRIGHGPESFEDFFLSASSKRLRSISPSYRRPSHVNSEPSSTY
jgi:hypothetical protein